MRPDAETERVLICAVDAFFDHLANRRLEEALAAFAPDADAALCGSEESEAVCRQPRRRRFCASSPI
jgi:hypothetical protein